MLANSLKKYSQKARQRTRTSEAAAIYAKLTLLHEMHLIMIIKNIKQIHLLHDDVKIRLGDQRTCLLVEAISSQLIYITIRQCLNHFFHRLKETNVLFI